VKFRAIIKALLEGMAFGVAFVVIAAVLIRLFFPPTMTFSISEHKPYTVTMKCEVWYEMVDYEPVRTFKCTEVE